MMIINSENFDKVLECFEEVLKRWIPALENDESLRGHELGPIMRDDIPGYFKELDLMDDERYIVNGSAGIGQFASIPWVAIFNERITAGAEKGYYIVLLFCEDMRGIYLSLNFGSEAFRIKYRQGRGRRNPYKEKLKQSAEFFRDILKEKYPIINSYDELNLGTNNLDRESPAEEYEAGDIFNIFYSKEDLKNITEEKFLDDLKLFLELYDYLYEKRGKDVFVDDEDKKQGNKSKEGESKVSTEKTFYQELKDQGLYYDKKTIENYLLSLKVKPFVILTGPSGTGKTKIAKEFADYINKEGSSEEYVTVKTKYSKIEDSRYFYLGKKTVAKLLDLGKYEGTMDFYFDDIKSNESIILDVRATCDDEEVVEHLETIEDLSKVTIKILKKDLLSTFFNEKHEKEQIPPFDPNVGKSPEWCIPKKYLHNLLPVKNECYWNAIIDGKKTTIRFWVHDVVIRLANSKNKELKDYIGQKDEKDKINIKAELDTFKFKNNKDDKGVEIESGKIRLEKTDNYKIVPVGANWTENRNIVGFYNPLIENYQSTPSLELLLGSKETKDCPYFLILDEMNLSHVERYFSDFLSAMESKKPIPLHNAGKDIKSENKNPIPEEVEINENLFIIGTVNVDETTYMFSPKVLDRANTIEIEAFEDISIKDYMTLKAYNDKDFKGDESYLINPLEGSELRDAKIEDLKMEFADVEYIWKELYDELTEINEALKPAGFEFGFRVVNEILRFMAVSKRYEEKNIKDGKWDNWQRYFDAQIKQKILPKLHGSHQTLDKPLRELFKICLQEPEVIPKLEDFNDEDAKYPESAKKLIQMINTLENQMYVSFIN